MALAVSKSAEEVLDTEHGLEDLRKRCEAVVESVFVDGDWRVAVQFLLDDVDQANWERTVRARHLALVAATKLKRHVRDSLGQFPTILAENNFRHNIYRGRLSER